MQHVTSTYHRKPSLPQISPTAILLALYWENSQSIEPNKRLKKAAPESEHRKDFPCILEILPPLPLNSGIILPTVLQRVRWVLSIFVPSLSCISLR